MDPTLCHVTTREAIRAERLTAYPFLHCCTEAQLDFVLRQHFAGRRGLVILHFDPASLPDGEIRWERSEPGMDPFPHLYGALPVALTRVAPAPAGWD